MSIEVATTIDLPFAYRERFTTLDGRRRRRRGGRFKGHVPIPPFHVEPSEMRPAIHVKWKVPRPSTRTSVDDRIWTWDDKLYRPLLIDGKSAGLRELIDSVDYQNYGSGIDAIRHLPPPDQSICTRWGTRSLESVYPRDEVAAREGWRVTETVDTDRDQCWGDAYAHYERSVLSVEGKLWFRCGEPCWYTGAWDRLIYEPHRNPYFAKNEYALDDPHQADAFPRSKPRESDADIIQLDWRCDHADFLLAAGRDLLEHATRIRKDTTRRIRNRAGVEAVLDELIAMVDEPLRPHDVASVVDKVHHVAERLMDDYDAHRQGRISAVRDVLHPAQSAKRRVERLRANEKLDDEDIEALFGVEFEP